MTSIRPGKDAEETSSFNTHDIVLAKLQGYPQWPARVVGPEGVPDNVMKQQPSGNEHYCVRFFSQGDYAWITSRNINPLPPTEIEQFIQAPKNTKRSGKLLKAYQAALDPTAWETAVDKEIVKRIADRKRDEGGAEDKKDNNDASYGKKKRRLSSKAPDSASKNRRRTGRKNDISKAVQGEGCTAAAAAPVQKKDKKKDDHNELYAHLENDPGAARIKYVRHALQRAFLEKNPLSNKVFQSSAALFKELEMNEISVEYLLYSKIGKVMRLISSLDDTVIQCEVEVEFGFKRRAQDLVSKWSKVANASDQRASFGGGVPSDSHVVAGTNGNGAAAGVGDLSMQH